MKEDDELAELYASQTTTTGKRKKARTAEQFIEDQSKFEQKKMQRLMQVVEKEQEKGSETFHPKISKNSEKILAKKKQRDADATVEVADDTMNRTFRKPAEV